MMSSPIYLNPSSQPPFPFEEHNQAQQDHEQLFNREHHQDDEEAEKYVLRDESSSGDQILSSTHSTDQQISDGNSSLQPEHEVTKDENYVSSGHIHHGLSIKWMSSKMRLMKKMSSTDHTVLDKQSQMAYSSLDIDNISSNNSSSSNNNFIRTCSDCNTTKTPLWRSGPRGPKSLCNACGIRQRKARRTMAAAQAEASDTLVTSETSSTNGNKLRIKAKRCKLTIRRSQKKHCFEDIALSLSKSSAYHQVFPQDEKEAAILLMALSCGQPSSWLNGFL